MRRGSAYKRLLRELGLSERMVSTLYYLCDRARGDHVKLRLGDAMSATGLQRHGLAAAHYDARFAPQLGWSVTQQGIAVAEQLRAARRTDSNPPPQEAA